MAPPAILGTRQVGKGIPPDTEHAISVSLPTWQVVMDNEARKQEVGKALETGYPRFFPHLSIVQLNSIFAKLLGAQGEMCISLRSKNVVQEADAFIRHRAALAGVPAPIRQVQHIIEDAFYQKRSSVHVHLILYPGNMHPFVAEFQEYTGLGISSRFAEYCLSLLPDELKEYRWKRCKEKTDAIVFRDMRRSEADAPVSRRPGDLSGIVAKEVLRKRIARAIVTGKVDDNLEENAGVQDPTADDVFLYPGGMAAIWNAYNLCLRMRPYTKSVVYGMPYFDTFKLLEKWGPGAHFYGFGHEADMAAFERLLEEKSRKDPMKPPILAVFTELPSNPLLRSPDLPRLRELADKYDFLLIIDETLGNFVNVEVLPFADIVITSLTKIFSGEANVMGGSIVLNPKGRHYKALASDLKDHYEDLYYDEDAVVMERNSRDLVRRVRIIDANTEALCAYLYERSVAGGASAAVIQDVFYPKYMDTNKYSQCKRPGGGYGGLFSLSFKTLAASKTFFDALPCYKGPTVGTTFTLAIPYTIFVFSKEITWAESYGLPEGLVRVNVGMEDQDLIIRAFDSALKAAGFEEQIDDTRVLEEGQVHTADISTTV